MLIIRGKVVCKYCEIPMVETYGGWLRYGCGCRDETPRQKERYHPKKGFGKLPYWLY